MSVNLPVPVFHFWPKLAHSAARSLSVFGVGWMGLTPSPTGCGWPLLVTVKFDLGFSGISAVLTYFQAVIYMKCLQSTSNCKCQTTAMATYTFLMYLVLCTPQAYNSPTVQLALAAHIEWFQAYNTLCLAVKPTRVATDGRISISGRKSDVTILFLDPISIKTRKFRRFGHK